VSGSFIAAFRYGVTSRGEDAGPIEHLHSRPLLASGAGRAVVPCLREADRHCEGGAACREVRRAGADGDCLLQRLPNLRPDEPVESGRSRSWGRLGAGRAPLPASSLTSAQLRVSIRVPLSVTNDTAEVLPPHRCGRARRARVKRPAQASFPNAGAGKNLDFRSALEGGDDAAFTYPSVVGGCVRLPA
jgi:hypothetical protein